MAIQRMRMLLSLPNGFAVLLRAKMVIERGTREPHLPIPDSSNRLL